MDGKTMSLRLSSEQAEELEAVAEVDGVPMAETVRTAIAEHIAQRRADRAFQDRLRESMERHRKVLEKLAQ